MDDVQRIVENAYGFHLYGITETGSRSILQTDRGLFYLFAFPATYRHKRRFVERVKKHVGASNGLAVLPTVAAADGKRVVLVDDELLCVHQGVREVTPIDPAFAAGQLFAQFHQATGAFTGEQLFLSYSSLGKWPGMWRNRLRSYDAYRDQVEADRGVLTPFDEYLLMSFTYVSQLADTAVRYLGDTGYQTAVKETAKFGKIAYQNVDAGYLVHDETGGHYLAGELGWVIDMRARDVGQWIKADIRQSGWDAGRTLRFLQGYQSIAPLLPEEYACVYALLLYPGRFLRMVETYSKMTAAERSQFDFSSWQTQLEDELCELEGALRDFPGLVLEHFEVGIPPVEWMWRRDPTQAELPYHL